MEAIKVTDANPKNARDIMNVLYKTWLATYPNKELGITKEHIEESYKDSFTEENLNRLAKKISNISEDEKRIVALQGEMVVGVATVVRKENSNQLKTIYVLPEFQGKGIGKMLWAEVAKFCDPTKDIFVQAATYNQNAIEFYKKLGFVDTGKRLNDAIWRMKHIGVGIPEMEMVIRARKE